MRTSKSNRSTKILPLLLMAIGALLVIAVFIWQFAVSAPAPVVIAATPTISSATLSVAEIERTSLEDAKKALDEKQAIVVDVRSYDVYVEEHIRGAVSIPFADIENKAIQLSKGQWIITYCT